MPIRNSAKAIVLYEGRLLLNHCVSRFGEYYALPGGGQRTGEMLTETVKRELLEETGYRVTPQRLSGIYERISDARSDEMNHKIYFIFQCLLDDPAHLEPTEQDRCQVGIAWIPLKQVSRVNLFPRAIRDNIGALVGYGETLFLGSEKECR